MRRTRLLLAAHLYFSGDLAVAELHDNEFDEVSLVQLHVEQQGAAAPAGAQLDQRGVYQALSSLLSGHSHLSHSLHILKYVAHSPIAPELGQSGCLYLPDDYAWRSFYQYVEHPWPPLFAELIENAYDPGCNMSQRRDLAAPDARVAGCPQGHVRGNHWELLDTDGQGMWPNRNNCVGVRHKGNAGGIQVYETNGHVGLPWKWQTHVHGVTQGGQLVPSIARKKKMRKRFSSDLCQEPSKLQKVPQDKMLVIPTRFVICCTDIASCPLDKDGVEDQVAWMNKGYSGGEPQMLEPFDRGKEPPHADMQVQFELINVTRVADKECAQRMFTDLKLAQKYNIDGEGILTYVIATDDQSGILGIAQFPTEVQDEKAEDLLVMINMFAFRGMSAKTNQRDLSYDEGDTCIHEGGHSLGLFHTFEGGCSDSDKVDDTNPEEFPSYACVDDRSCGSPDPVHNFMDYAPDTCMNGFTESQKRRMWCVIQNHRPVMYNRSLRARPLPATARASAPPALKAEQSPDPLSGWRAGMSLDA